MAGIEVAKGEGMQNPHCAICHREILPEWPRTGTLDYPVCMPCEGAATEKKPQLFYYEEGLNAWIPAPERVDEILDTEALLCDGDTVEIKFKRVDMSDIEVLSLPDA